MTFQDVYNKMKNTFKIYEEYMRKTTAIQREKIAKKIEKENDLCRANYEYITDISSNPIIISDICTVTNVRENDGAYRATKKVLFPSYIIDCTPDSLNINFSFTASHFSGAKKLSIGQKIQVNGAIIAEYRGGELRYTECFIVEQRKFCISFTII